jgi:hypothetical protein
MYRINNVSAETVTTVGMETNNPVADAFWSVNSLLFLFFFVYLFLFRVLWQIFPVSLDDGSFLIAPCGFVYEQFEDNKGVIEEGQTT